MRLFAVLLLLIVLPLAGTAQTPSISVHRTAVPPVIDGYGTDAAWSDAPPASGFLQREPRDGAPATDRTEFRVLVDDGYLYVHAMMYDDRPDSIVHRLARRDEFPESDWFGITVDSYHDRQTAFVFVVFVSGSRYDALNYNDGRNEDASWDPVWQAETRVLPNGWSAEFRIPLSQLRFTEGNDVWGFNAARKVIRRGEETNWSLMSKNAGGFASLFGTLTGMAAVKEPALFEALPYAVASSEHRAERPGRARIERLRPNAGADVKVGLGSGFTMDAAVNPDFAQVEADPAVLNLTTFETFYPEKRPFFIEGTQIIRFVTFGGDFGPGLFYSRRIGRPIDPPLPADGAAVTDEPGTATILGAVKVSGKTAGGTSLGVLTAVTEEESFTYRDTLGGERTLRAEPAAFFSLVRAKQDFWENSNIGGILTATARDGRRPAYTMGTDWDLRLAGNAYRINGFLAHSRTMTPAGELRAGGAGKFSVARVSGDWTWSANADFTTKRYYINDIGFFRSPNDYGMSGSAARRSFEPGSWYRQYNVSLNPHLRWNYDRVTIARELRLNTYVQFLNYWQFETGWGYSAPAQDPYDPRGLGVYRTPGSYFVRAEVETDGRAAVVVNVEENVRRNTQGAVIANTAGKVTVRPAEAAEAAVSFGYATERGFNAFADAVTDAAITFSPSSPVAMFGKRDVDGTDLTLRGSFLFTHALSLQLYHQFFWAKGRYREFSVLRPDGGLDPYPYTGTVEFNGTSFVSNIVLRWEYRPGSTVYLVWSHGREFEQAGGYGTSPADNVRETFRARPDNVYVVKASYWMEL